MRYAAIESDDLSARAQPARREAIGRLVDPRAGVCAAVRGHGRGRRGEVALLATCRAFRRVLSRGEVEEGPEALLEALLVRADAELLQLGRGQRVYPELTASVAIACMGGGRLMAAATGGGRVQVLRAAGETCVLDARGEAGRPLGRVDALRARACPVDLSPGDELWLGVADDAVAQAHPRDRSLGPIAARGWFHFTLPAG